MPISEKEFAELKGAPSRVGGVNPNSMAQRILKIVPDKGGMTAEEVISEVREDGDDEKKLKQALDAHTYDKVKNAKGERTTKVIKKYNKEGIAFYKKNPEYFN